MDDPNNPPINDDVKKPEIETQANVEQEKSVIPSVLEIKAELNGSIDAPYGYKKDGTPAKKRGRKPDDLFDTAQTDALDSVTPAPPRRQQSPPKITTPVIVTDYRALGRTAAAVFFVSGELILGQEWAPDSPTEGDSIAGAFSRYFEASGIQELSPGLMLTLTLGSYSVARMQRPVIKTKIQKATEWITSKLKLFKRQ